MTKAIDDLKVASDDQLSTQLGELKPLRPLLHAMRQGAMVVFEKWPLKVRQVLVCCGHGVRCGKKLD